MNPPDMIQTVTINGYGDPDVRQGTELLVPQLGDGEVLIDAS